MAKIQIKNRWNGAILFKGDFESIALALVAAVASGVNLCGADLRWANLREAKTDNGTKLTAYCLTPDGEFFAYKKLQDGVIAKLRIPSEAKRVSTPVGRKCRAEYAEVISMVDKSGSEVAIAKSRHDESFVYRVGEIVRPDHFDDDWRIECAPGIHFFITRQEAVDY